MKVTIEMWIDGPEDVEEAEPVEYPRFIPAMTLLQDEFDYISATITVDGEPLR